jgi:hypothetical protein
VQDGETAFLLAAGEGAEDCLQVLVENKADIFAVNEVPCARSMILIYFEGKHFAKQIVLHDHAPHSCHTGTLYPFARPSLAYS